MYGGIPGGQAELVMVPKANTGPFKVPGTLADEKVLFLSDILPTAWQAVLNANIGQGSSLAIYGAGPVGLLSAACARMLGAERIFMVDHHVYHLDYAQRTYGVIPVNFDDDDPADSIIRQTPDSRGWDGVIDAVGFGNADQTTETDVSSNRMSGWYSCFTSISVDVGLPPAFAMRVVRISMAPKNC